MARHGPTPRLRREEPQILDETPFVDPDDDEDCRAGLQELDPLYPLYEDDDED